MTSGDRTALDKSNNLLHCKTRWLLVCWSRCLVTEFVSFELSAPGCTLYLSVFWKSIEYAEVDQVSSLKAQSYSIPYSHQDFAAEEAAISEDKSFLDNFMVGMDFQDVAKSVSNAQHGWWQSLGDVRNRFRMGLELLVEHWLCFRLFLVWLKHHWWAVGMWNV